MNQIYEFGPFKLEVRERRLSSNGTPIRLRPKIFDTLCALVERQGSLVDKDELMKLVWPDTIVEENNLALNIAALRKALGEADPAGKWIETVSGKGYRFLQSVRRLESTPRQDLRPAENFDTVQPERTPGSELLERDSEITVLRESLRLALRARRQFVCITGEAGIGKTALLQSFLRELSPKNGSVITGSGQCIERSGEGEAYMPILEALGKLCRGSHGSEVTDLVSRYAPTWLVQLPSLVAPGAFSVLRERVLGVTRDRMMRELPEALEAIATSHPVAIVVEDLHWADPSTIELISALARRPEPARLIVIATNRGSDAGESGQTVERLTEELQLREQCRLIRPRPLSANAITQLAVRRTPGSVLSSQLATTIRERTAGNPLFAQALVDYWASHGAGAALPRGIPGSLAAMIQRKLEGLNNQDEEILECASVIGMSFSTAIAAAVLGRNEEEVETRCSDVAAHGTTLRESGLAEWPDGTISADFTFGHSLFQEALYAQISPIRKSRLHRRAGECLEGKLGEHAAQRASELAHHFLEGRSPERALVYLQAAAEAALQRSAPQEAAVHLRRGLSLLKTLPGTPENQACEFRLLAMFAPTVIATEGFSAAEAEPSYQRAFELGRQLGEMERAYPVLLGKAFMHELRGEYLRTEELLDRDLKSVAIAENSTVAVHADSLIACSLFHQGKFTGALERAEHGLGIYDPARDREFLAPYGENPSIACQAWAALCLWFLGFPDRAAERVLRLVSFAETPNHLFARSTGTLYATHVYQLRREAVEAAKWADITLDHAEAQGYLYNIAFAKVVKGWAAVKSAAREEGLGFELIRHGLTIVRAIGAKLDQPYLLALQAEAQIQCKQYAAASDSIAEALSLVRTSRAFFYEAELYRLRAAVALAKKSQAAAGDPENDLTLALEVARRQGAKSLELRAAVDFAGILAGRGQTKAARKFLEPIRASFDEGFATEDLKQADVLLEDKNPPKHKGTKA